MISLLVALVSKCKHTLSKKHKELNGQRTNFRYSTVYYCLFVSVWTHHLDSFIYEERGGGLCSFLGLNYDYETR